MRVLITGLAKTGTTGVFTLVRNSLAGRVATAFETHVPVCEGEGPADHTVVKLLIDAPATDLGRFADFERRILIVRDPRDRLVSGFLYSAGYHGAYYLDDARVERMIAALEAKEHDPAAVPLRDLVLLHRELNGTPETPADRQSDRLARSLARAEAVGAAGGWFTLRYEDFVDGRLDALEAYLGLGLSGGSDVDPSVGRVVRTRGYGNWTNWLTGADVAYYRPVFEDFIARHGYDPTWQLPAEPRIDPQHGSRYVRRLIEGKRREHDEAVRRRLGKAY